MVKNIWFKNIWFSESLECDEYTIESKIVLALQLAACIIMYINLS